MARDHARIPALRIEEASSDARLRLTDAEGHHLYRLTESGNVVRTRKLTKRRREQVLERDGHRCILCASTTRLEVDHIVRYSDGGSHDLVNLRTLCHDCHAKRGAR